MAHGGPHHPLIDKAVLTAIFLELLSMKRQKFFPRNEFESGRHFPSPGGPPHSAKDRPSLRQLRERFFVLLVDRSQRLFEALPFSGFGMIFFFGLPGFVDIATPPKYSIGSV
jgi:hypothetical protein